MAQFRYVPTYVTLNMATSDYNQLGQLSSIFTLNKLGTPTLVIRGSVTWGSQTGKPSSSPAAWDRKFPFTISYVHTGALDISMDFDFSGGKLAKQVLRDDIRRLIAEEAGEV